MEVIKKLLDRNSLIVDDSVGKSKSTVGKVKDSIFGVLNESLNNQDKTELGKDGVFRKNSFLTRRGETPKFVILKDKQKYLDTIEAYTLIAIKNGNLSKNHLTNLVLLVENNIITKIMFYNIINIFIEENIDLLERVAYRFYHESNIDKEKYLNFLGLISLNRNLFNDVDMYEINKIEENDYIGRVAANIYIERTKFTDLGNKLLDKLYQEIKDGNTNNFKTLIEFYQGRG